MLTDCLAHDPVDTDPTGGDPWMGGPVAITVCRRCGLQLKPSPAAQAFNTRVARLQAEAAPPPPPVPPAAPRRHGWRRLIGPARVLLAVAVVTVLTADVVDYVAGIL